MLKQKLNIDILLEISNIINTDNILPIEYYEKYDNIYYPYFSDFAYNVLWGFWRLNEPSCDKLTYAIGKTFKKYYNNVKIKWAIFGNLNDFYHVIPIICANKKEIVIDLTYSSQHISPGFIFEYNKNMIFKNGGDNITLLYESNDIDELPEFHFNNLYINWNDEYDNSLDKDLKKGLKSKDIFTFFIEYINGIMDFYSKKLKQKIYENQEIDKFIIYNKNNNNNMNNNINNNINNKNIYESVLNDNDISKYDNLFEGINLSAYSPKDIINSKKVYDYIIESNQVAKAENVSMDEIMDEGLFGSLIGGAIGATVGQSIMKAVCKCLGIDEKGTLGNLLTSKLVLTAMGAQLGYRW